MGMPPMNRPPMGGGAPSPSFGGGAPSPDMGGGGAGLDFASSLRELQQSLPPEVQSRLDPSNPITQLLFKRLKDGISDQEGQELLMLIGNASPAQRAAFGKFLPEIIILMDIFDDGEINDSVGMGEGGGPGGAPPAGAAPARPETSRPAPSPDYEEDDEDDEPYGGGALSRLSQVRA